MLSFTNIRIGEAGAPDVEMERFRAEVELAPLLKGEVRIIQMSVERPRFHMDLAGLAEPQPPGAAGGWRIDAERISLARLEIIGGSAVVADSRAGRVWQADAIDAVVEASSLHGPGRINANLVFAGTQFTVRAGLGRLNPDETLAVNITVASPRYPVTLALDGALSLAAGVPPQYRGVATVAGLQPQTGDEPRSAWADFRTIGTVELTPSALTVEQAQVSYGALERPLVLEASARLDLGAEPRYDLSINARQIDLDRTLVQGEERPPTSEGRFADLLRVIPKLPRPAIPGQFHLDAEGVVINGSVIQAVGLDLAAVEGGWRIDSLAAMLPGETRVDLQGTIDAAVALAFNGHGRISSARPAALASWWRGRVGSAGALESFTVQADLDLRTDSQRVTNIVAATSRGRMTGSVDFRTLSGQRFVTVDLDAERADLAESRAVTELLLGDVMKPGGIDQLTLSLRTDVLSASGIEARSVVIEGGLEDGRLDLRTFSIEDLAGASIDVRGGIADPFGVPSGRLDASVKAADLRGAAEFMSTLLPDNAVIAHLRDAAPILSPAEAEISAEAGTAGDSLSVVLSGSFAGTHVNLNAEGAGSLGDPETLIGSGSLNLDGADSATVLAQFGLQPIPVPAGPLSLDAEFEGSPTASGKLDLQATIAGVALTYAAESAVRDAGIAITGELKAETADLDPALLLAGFAVPGLGEGHAASAAGRLDLGPGKVALDLREGSFDGEPVTGSLQAAFGAVTRLEGSLAVQHVSLPWLASLAAGTVPSSEGGWSKAAFSVAVPPEIALDVRIDAGTLDLGLPMPAGNAALRFGLSQGTLHIDLANADLAGGKLKGAIEATVGGGEAQLAVRGALQGAQLQSLVWERSGLPIASGLIDASFDVKGGGRSMAGLVSTLAGTGSFAIEEGRVISLNPGALATVMEAAGRDEEPDEQLARETFAIHFGSGLFSFGRAAGSFSVAAGIVNVATVSVSAGDVTILADASFDLNNFTLSSGWTIRVGEADAPEERRPQVRVLFSGPISRPERRVDLAPLLDVLRSNYLQRQLDELEELEEARRRAEERRRRLDAQELPALPVAPNAGPGPEANPLVPGETAPVPDQPAPGISAPIPLRPPEETTNALGRPVLLAPPQPSGEMEETTAIPDTFTVR